MPETLPLAKAGSQEKLCCGEIDILRRGVNTRRMAGTGEGDGGRLYLAEWLRALGMKKRALANNSGVSEPYISQLSNNKKENPSREKLNKIADALDITIRDLYAPPPSREVIEAMQRLSPTVTARLQKRRKAS